MSWPNAELTTGELAIAGNSMPTTKSAGEPDVAFLRALLHRRQNAPNSICSRPAKGGEQMSRSRRVAMAITAALQQNEVASPASINDFSLYRDVNKISPLIPQTDRAFATDQSDLAGSSLTSADLRNQKLPLPMKLHAILSRPEFESIVSWMPHGRAWKIVRLEDFIESVLPLFLNYGSSQAQHLNTFVRLLKIWGFRQFTKGADSSAFYHEMFVRGKPQLLRGMQPSDTNIRLPFHDASREPDFYNLAGAPSKLPGNSLNYTSTSASIMEQASHCKSTNSSVQALSLHGISRGRMPAGALPRRPLLQPKGCTLANSFLQEKDPDSFTGFQNNASCLNAIRAQMVKDLRASESFHDETLNSPHSNGRLADVSVSPKPVSASSDGDDLQVQVLSPSRNKGSAATVKKSHATKKPRRKWLPPLGPATGSTSTLLHKPSITASPIPAYPPTGAVSAPSEDRSACEWLYTNPEVFASLSNPSSAANPMPY